MIIYEKTVLSNGLRVIKAPMHETKASAILIMVGTGSRYEKDKDAGLSHFLEHMFFKGTKRRPSYLDVSIELDSLGANYNAFTGQEYTGYFVHASSDQFARSFDILADMLLEGTLPEIEIAKEKGVITEELNMYWDMPQSAVALEVDKLLYGKNPLGRPIVGTKHSIASTTRASLLNYKKTNYTPSNMIVAIAGNPNHGDWLATVKKYFGGLKRSKAAGFEKFTVLQSAPQVAVIKRQTDQAHFVVGWPAIKRTDSRRPILRVMNTILGGMMSSRLFDEIREKRGLAYYVNSSFDEFHDAGSLQARAGVVVSKIEDAVKVTIDTVMALAKQPVTSAELKRAKDNIKGQLYLGLENSFAVAEFLADQELLWGHIEQPEEILKKVENVSSSDIMGLAKEILRPEKVNLAVIGPYEDKKTFNKIVGI